MQKLLPRFIGAAILTVASVAVAHTNFKPAHGGIIRMMGEFSLELVRSKEGVEIYVTDDGDPLPSLGLTGTLTIDINGARSEVPLQPAGNNKFLAKGLQLASGAKVAAVVVRADQSRIGARFTIK
jgi:hypothetical protein